MKTTKTHSLAIKTGKYVKDNIEKNTYLYIGSIMENEFGKFILLNKTFNPAGVISDTDQILINVLPVKTKDSINKKAPEISEGFNDDIEVPF